jgi:hypothetical protein
MVHTLNPGIHLDEQRFTDLLGCRLDNAEYEKVK